MKVIQKVLEKLKNKFLLSFHLVRYTSYFAPCNIIYKEEVCVSRFGKLLMIPYENKWLNLEEANNAKDQYETFRY